ncbi:hypothetical protein KM176_05930 [Pseudooceanicola sp. CBS1P-1]|uniref:DUF7282 domain-containing protein n=1 Tax=Pseudooceanicola albus TaxID=2692189 RepID=A0A6L7FYG2_9RHOB|nr:MULTISPECIES: hypothetical protein [Pseudooceanicola]MBT9383390.1 hypothetical protein [Pseudooceanicola endophyticus]MXN16288.1 hypothetical protein [Pseudooceanicola albus]
MKTLTLALAGLALAAGAAQADGHMTPMVMAMDQSVANGVVSASEVMAPENGWLVVHRTDAEMKPGPVVGYAPLRAGKTSDVAALLSEPVAPGDMLMLMIHSEAGGMSAGQFEYTLGATEDGPIKPGGKLVMAVVTAR